MRETVRAAQVSRATRRLPRGLRSRRPTTSRDDHQSRPSQRCVPLTKTSARDQRWRRGRLNTNCDVRFCNSTRTRGLRLGRGVRHDDLDRPDAGDHGRAGGAAGQRTCAPRLRARSEPVADAGLLTLPARSASEARFLAVGKIMDRHFTAVFTERAGKVRLISVRRSRMEERDLYERNQ